jgi:HAD superfamily hydrolase (TIGR01509 family)
MVLHPAPHHRALIFDWDGTVADSQAVNYAVLRDALAEHGCDLAEPWFAARTGMSTRDMVTLIARLDGRTLDPDVVAARRDALYLSRVHEVAAVADVVAVLRSARPVRATALATGGGRGTVLPTVEALGLADAFDVIVTRNDVSAGKPSPELFLLAADRLGADPAACLVYEDSDEGLAAAHAAGMDAVDVRRRTRVPWRDRIN